MSKSTKMDMVTVAKERPMIFGGPMVKALLEDRKTQTRRVVTPQPFKSDHDPEMWLRSRGRRSYNSNCRHEEVRNRHTGEVLSERQYYLPLEEWLAEQCPYGQPGDRLWVRETAYIAPPNFGDPIDANARDDEGRPRVVGYAASMGGDAVRCAEDYGVRKTPSIHMPRWASRITLEITEVRVERLQEISDEDCWAEGLSRIGDDLKTPAPILICSESRPRPGMAFAVQPRPVATYAGSPFMTFAFLWDSINNPRDYCPEDAPNGWDANPYVWAITFKRLKP